MKVLFFAPNSAIAPFTHVEAVLANSLLSRGDDVYFLTCGRLYSGLCTAMLAQNLAPDASEQARKAVCDRCCGNARLVRELYKLPGSDLHDLATPEDLATVRNLLEAIDTTNFTEFHMDGVPLGKRALYELILLRKKNALDLDSTEWQLYLHFLRNSILTFIIARRFLQEMLPHVIVIYNPLYAVNNAFSAAGNLLGIPTYHIHACENLALRSTHLFAARGNTFVFRQNLKAMWHKRKDQPASGPGMRQTALHFAELIKAQSLHVYSAAQDTKTNRAAQVLSIDPSAPLALATLSSYDERFAGEISGNLDKANSLTFKSQIEWIAALIEHFRNRPQWNLVIRVHPREFPNRRDSVTSQHAQQLARHFQDLPSNVKINWPEENISLYDLAEVSDIVLNAWSSAGEELALMGIPVLIYSPDLVMYPSDINWLETDRAQYFARIDNLISEPLAAQYARNIFRWYGIKMHDTSFKIIHHRRPRNMFRIYAQIRIWIYRIKNRLTRRAVIDLNLLHSIHKTKLTVPIEGFAQMLLRTESLIYSSPNQDRDSGSLTEETQFLLQYYGQMLRSALHRQSPAKYITRIEKLLKTISSQGTRHAT